MSPLFPEHLFRDFETLNGWPRMGLAGKMSDFKQEARSHSNERVNLHILYCIHSGKLKNLTHMCEQVHYSHFD